MGRGSARLREISRQCLILVGGLGTRLGSLTADCPKPLLDVDGQPFLGHLIDNVRRFGFDDFILLAGFKPERVVEFARGYASDRAVKVRVVTEDSPAGTAGALLSAKPLLEEEFLLLNGDSIFDFNILDLASRDADEPWIGRIALRRVPDTSRYGRVELNGDQISKMQEKCPDRSEGLINGGVYWLKRALVDLVDRVPLSLERDVFPALVGRGELLGFEYGGAFIDIGVPEDLKVARENWREILRQPATFFDRDGVLNKDSGYTHKRDEFHWIDGAKAAIKQANDDGRFVFVVTNQAGVARGYYDEAAVQDLHAWMNEDLRRDGAHIDDFRYCPHHPEGIVPELSILCECRKPNPGMIESLLAEWPVDLSDSVLIGDKESDLQAAAAAGVSGFQFDGSNFDWRENSSQRSSRSRSNQSAS
jgi:D-glycero-D-manno-heptose 1,7-bisphosphate phosphatase